MWFVVPTDIGHSQALVQYSVQSMQDSLSLLRLEIGSLHSLRYWAFENTQGVSLASQSGDDWPEHTRYSAC